MKKILLPLLFCVATIGPAFGQDYDKILSMIVDEKYEKALDKSISYTLNDKTKKHPLPYLYASKCYYELSKMGEMAEDYPKAFKNSLKYASKYVKKDKQGEHISDWEDFFAELRNGAMEEASMEFDKDKFSKAKGLYKYLINFDNQDAGAHLMKALCEEKAKAKKDAMLSAENARKALSERSKDDFTDEQLLLLKGALMNYSEFLSDAGRSGEAKEWLEQGMAYFEDDAEFKVTYQMING